MGPLFNSITDYTYQHRRKSNCQKNIQPKQKNNTFCCHLYTAKIHSQFFPFLRKTSFFILAKMRQKRWVIYCFASFLWCVLGFSLFFIYEELLKTVSTLISPIAKPEKIQWAPNLPKTRSGKIMRRILRKIAANETEELGDISTLADPSAVDELIKNRKNL